MPATALRISHGHRVRAQRAGPEKTEYLVIAAVLLTVSPSAASTSETQGIAQGATVVGRERVRSRGGLGPVATAIPFTPGGGGAQQALLAFALGGSASQAQILAFSVGQQIIVTVANIALGVVALLNVIGHVHLRRLGREPATPPESIGQP